MDLQRTGKLLLEFCEWNSLFHKQESSDSIKFIKSTTAMVNLWHQTWMQNIMSCSPFLTKLISLHNSNIRSQARAVKSTEAISRRLEECYMWSFKEFVFFHLSTQNTLFSTMSSDILRPFLSKRFHSFHQHSRLTQISSFPPIQTEEKFEFFFFQFLDRRRKAEYHELKDTKHSPYLTAYVFQVRNVHLLFQLQNTWKMKTDQRIHWLCRYHSFTLQSAAQMPPIRPKFNLPSRRHRLLLKSNTAFVLLRFWYLHPRN